MVTLTMSHKVYAGLAGMLLLVGLLSFTGIRAVHTLHGSIDDIVATQAQGGAQTQDAAAQARAAEGTYRSTLGWQFSLLGLVLVVGAGFGVWMFRVNRGLARTASALHIGAEQVMSAASQVSTSAQSLSAGATHQAASLQETSASMTEMADMTRQNAENSQGAAALMAELEGHVALSNQALRDMVNSMDSIGESSGKVAKIIKTIDEIAFQTNILALNAAVEAARAGEAGMGFAVVADEVRHLAQRSAQAAKDTAGLIDEASSNAAQGGAKVEQVAVAITAITDSIARVKALVDDVSSASRQQAQGIQQVTEAVSAMEQVTQTTAATAEESAAASEELSAQAETTRHLVAELDALIGAARAETQAGWAVAPPAARPPLPAQAPVRTPAKALAKALAKTPAKRPAPAPAPIPAKTPTPGAPQRMASLRRGQTTPQSAEAFIPFEDGGNFSSFADKDERSWS